MKKIKKYIVLAASVLLAFSFEHTMCDEKPPNTFSDVPESEWYYIPVTELCKNFIIPDTDMFYGDSAVSRGDLVCWLYNLDSRVYGAPVSADTQPFSDVRENSRYYEAVCWAASNNIASGFGDGTFGAEAQCPREQLCVMVMRYFNRRGISPSIIADDGQFADSLSVSGFARSYVAACRMCGIIRGDDDGYFRPQDAATRAQSAAVIYTVMNISVGGGAGSAGADTSPGAYDYLYDGYKTEEMYLFNAYVPECGPVDLKYFDDAVFVGDSVSQSLQYYCAASGALGNAKFLCAGSLSPANALWEVSDKSLHPLYGGVKMALEDSVALSGANKLYIMLGINSLAGGAERTIADLRALIETITAKSPRIKVFAQSVTPMTSDSPIKTDALNNNTIIEYNQKLLALCQEKGWYYLNVAENLRDSYGNLNKSYCSDPKVMGIHFNFAADKIWCDYLITHVPEKLR